MDEYIGRESIYKTLSMEKPFVWNNDDLAELFRGAKPADVAPVRRGRWMDNEDYMFCSCCGMQWNYCDNDTQDFHYCPNCGCKMDLEG